MLKLRPHHLICLRLFQGCGYNDAFTARMGQIHAVMTDSPDTVFILVTGADDICEACPNRTAQGACVLSEDGVRGRDARALGALGLAAGGKYSFLDAGARMRKSMTPESFESVCACCRWHEAGICSFERLMEKR